MTEVRLRKSGRLVCAAMFSFSFMMEPNHEKYNRMEWNGNRRTLQ